MAPYDDWNRLDEEEDEELQDTSFFDGKKDVILFAIDCSESMLELRDDPNYEDGTKTCHLLTALEAARQIQKKKVIVGPNDAVGIMMFNTTKTSGSSSQAAEIKGNTFLYQPITTISAPKVQELTQLVDAARENPDFLRETFPPVTTKRIPMGDVFTSCNWVMRDGAPKTASKRVFLITDEDDPNVGPGKERLMISARTTLIDLTQAGIVVEPFFIQTKDKVFNKTKFYSSVLLPSNVNDDEGDSTVLPESNFITRIDDLLEQMRFHEVPKRALFSIPFELADGFVIGIKGYNLVSEQRKGAYKYFADLGDRMELANSRTVYVDEDREVEVEKSKIVFGMSLGETVGVEEDEDEDSFGGVTRSVAAHSRVFYTPDEVKSFRTLGLEPRIKLLGFKSRKELGFEDNVKHSFFIYPDEMTFSGSKRTFSALLKTMIKKKKMGLVLVLSRRNSSPVFCALLPQTEKQEKEGCNEPAGFHLVPLPFADDIRAAPIESAYRASDETKDAARKWIDKLRIRDDVYPPDSYPNPALAYHNAQLEASAFREVFDPNAFEDLTLPKYGSMHKRVGELLREWRQAISQDEAASVVEVPYSKKRKADTTVNEVEIRAYHESGQLFKLRVDQLKAFCKSCSLQTAGKKAELVERVGEYLDTN